MAKKKTQAKIVINENLHQQINILSAQTKMTMQEWGNIFCSNQLNIINQAKEQGVEDENIADFLEYCMENNMTDTHIALMVQNFQDSLEAEEK